MKSPGDPEIRRMIRGGYKRREARMMKAYNKRQYILGIAAILVVFASIITVYSLMRRTNLKDISMDPGGDMGWSYEIISGSEARPVEPELVDEFTVSFPGESGRAVRAERTITEELERAHLGIFLYDAVCGVDIFLDDDMIYTSFEGAARDGSGFAVTDGLPPSPSEKIEVYLPEDYIGRRLTVVSYFPTETDELVPVFPYLCSSDTQFALTSVENVAPITHAAICAFLAILTALIYLLDIQNGTADKKVLLLALFYLLMFLTQGFNSNAGKYSLLPEKLYMLDFVSEVRIAPLLLFAAFSMTSARRWILAGATGAWLLFDVVKLIRARYVIGPFAARATAFIMLILMLLTLVFAIIEMRHRKVKFKKTYIVYVLIAAVVSVIRVLNAKNQAGIDSVSYLKQLFVMPFQGYFYPLMQYIIFIGVVTVTAVVIVEFVNRTLYSRVMLGVIEEQNKRAMESYKRMSEAEEATYAIRHEVRHHMLTMSAMLKNGETDMAREYAAALTTEYNDLPEGQYSKNIMVNIIAGEYLSRAKLR